MIWILLQVALLVNGKELSDEFREFGKEVKSKLASKGPLESFAHPLLDTDFCIGKRDGNYPSSRCGTKFFSCGGGLTTVRQCPGSLIFDPILDRCELPSQSPYCTKGRVRITQPTSPIPTAAPRKKPYFSCRQKRDGLFVDRKHPCRPFYFSCSNGEASVMHCPEGLFFDPELQMCDRYSNIPVCTGRPRPITKKPEPSKKPIVVEPVNFSCRGRPTGNYPDPHSTRPYCSPVYYTCSNGVATKRRCPPSLFYDPKFDVCDRFHNIYACTGRHIERTVPPRTTPQPTVPPVPFDCRHKKDGYYVNPRASCSATYYACSGGIARMMKCQYGLAFDPETNTCQQPSLLRICGGRPLPKTLPTKPPHRYPTPPPPIDCSYRPNGLYPDPLRRCSRIFYACSNGQPIRMQCPRAMAYDHRTKSCQLAGDLYICTGRHTTTPRPTRRPTLPPPVPFDCSRKPDGLYPNPKRACSLFYYACSNGIARKLECPEGLFYDPHEQICDVYSNIYACTGRRKPITRPPSYSGRIRPSNEFDCFRLPSGLYPVPGRRCNDQFFQCSNGVAYKLHCGHGLFFDPQHRRCDRFQNIYDCTGRVQPEYKPARVVQPAHRPEFEKIPVDCIQLGDGDHAEPGVLYGRTYYTCFNGRGVRRQCPKGTFFHVILKRCESLESLKSMRRAQFTVRPRQRVNYDFCFDKPDGNYPKGRCSSEFVTCSGGVSTHRYCPSGLYFDVDRAVCDFKENIPACGGSRPQPPPPAPKRRPAHLGVPFDCTIRPDGNYPLKACANNYAVCRGGHASMMRCPEHLIFSEELRGCDYAYRTPSCKKSLQLASGGLRSDLDY